MKIQIVSDLHEDCSRFKVNKTVDLVINAGDFSKSNTSTIEPIEEFVLKCLESKKQCAFVLGNHDYYGHSLQNNPLIQECIDCHYNIITLDRPFDFKGYNFIGGMFGTDFKLPGDLYKDIEVNKALCKSHVMDFYRIYSNKTEQTFISPEEYLEFFNTHLEGIESYRHKDNTVLVSHFPLSHLCTDPKFINNSLNPYFINDIDLTGFKTVISGHTHSTRFISIGDTDIHINASGYTSRYHDEYQVECADFNPEYIIEI